MKFKATSYHLNLLNDIDRISVFNEAILDYLKNLNDSKDSNDFNDFNDSNERIAFDLGCGSGVLTYLAKDYFDKVISIDINPKIIKYTKENLADFENVEVYCDDVIGFDFKNKADLIICEMLDTALIDEEEVPVLNYAKKFLKEDGIIIPQGIINSAELIYMEPPYFQYEDDKSNANYISLSESVFYSEFDFLDDIDENFSKEIQFKLFDDEGKFIFSENYSNLNYFNKEKETYKVNAIKLTSFTKLNDKLIAGPTPMLNPVMLIPIDEVELKLADSIKIVLSYIMGQGVETINTKILH